MSKREENLARAKEYLALEKNEYFLSELQKVIDSNDDVELNDRFYRELEFGTAGLRGVVGGGFNRMNSFIVNRATQGLANYVLKAVEGEHSAVIAYDSRHFSDVFAKNAALILVANGFKVYLYESLRPTPQVSYAVSKLKTSVGIMVTASHNPSEYNGYKVFWSNGSQIIAPHDKGIADEVLAVGSDIKFISEDEALDNGSLVYLDSSIDDEYIEMVESYLMRPDVIKEYADKISVVYTPLNGAGRVPVCRVFDDLGVRYELVPEQAEPDGDFPTIPYPNPEIAEAMFLATELGKKLNADLVVGTDPDSDRIGIAVPDGDEFRLISGNQLGAMLTYYMITTKKELGELSNNFGVIKTIVTTILVDKICSDMGGSCSAVLTGFKWIAKEMKEFEQKGIQFVLGFEESYGYLIEKEVRDKDAVGAAALVTEMTLYCKSKGMSLLDYLNSIYKKFGYYNEFSVSKYFKGESGLSIMQGIMDEFRNNPLKSLAGIEIVKQIDFLNDDTGLAKSNVLQYFLSDGSVISVRPSGTEPKIKFYGSCGRAVESSLEETKTIVDKLCKDIEKDITKILPE